MSLSAEADLDPCSLLRRGELPRDHDWRHPRTLPPRSSRLLLRQEDQELDRPIQGARLVLLVKGGVPGLHAGGLSDTYKHFSEGVSLYYRSICALPKPREVEAESTER